MATPISKLRWPDGKESFYLGSRHGQRILVRAAGIDAPSHGGPELQVARVIGRETIGESRITFEFPGGAVLHCS